MAKRKSGAKRKNRTTNKSKARRSASTRSRKSKKTAKRRTPAKVAQQAPVFKALTTRQPKWVQPTLAALNCECNAVAICADASIVVAGIHFVDKNQGNGQGAVFAFDSSGNQLYADQFNATAPPKPDKPRAGIDSVSISKDGQWAAGGGLIGANSGVVNAYDSAGTRTTVVSPPARVMAVALNADGSMLAAGADQLYVSRRTGAGWSTPQTWSDPAGGVERLSISDDGQWIVAVFEEGWVLLIQNQIASGGGLSLAGKWHMKAADPKRAFIMDVSMAADGSAFAAGGADGRCYYFKTAVTNPPEKMARLWQFNPPGDLLCRWVSVSDDGQNVAALFSWKKINAPHKQGTVYLLHNDPNDPNGFTCPWTNAADIAGSPNCISMATDSAGNRYIAASDGVSATQGAFYLLDGGTGGLNWNCPTTKMCYCISLSDNAKAAAGGSNDAKVYYFDVP